MARRTAHGHPEQRPEAGQLIRPAARSLSGTGCARSSADLEPSDQHVTAEVLMSKHDRGAPPRAVGSSLTKESA